MASQPGWVPLHEPTFRTAHSSFKKPRRSRITTLAFMLELADWVRARHVDFTTTDVVKEFNLGYKQANRYLAVLAAVIPMEREQSGHGYVYRVIR